MNALFLLLPLFIQNEQATPESVGMSSKVLLQIDDAVNEGVARRSFPRAVASIGRRGKVIYQKEFGRHGLDPFRGGALAEKDLYETIFDLASLTKVVATAPSIMILVDDGKLRIDDPVIKYIPEFAAGGRERDKITIEQLLTHRAGFAADDSMDLYYGSPQEIFARKYKQKLLNIPGLKFVYSDVGYEVLGEIIRIVSGKPLDDFATERIFQPLQMKDTRFIRNAEAPANYLNRIAATAPGINFEATKGGRNIQLRPGEVHDPRARVLGGVAGHAGLFSTGSDLSKFCIAILSGGGGVLSPESVAVMTRPRFYHDTNIRGLGFDISTAYSGARGSLFPLGSFGHTGFTGTSLWCDPVSQTFIILLTNAVFVEGGTAHATRKAVATLAAASITDSDATAWTALDGPIRSHIAYYEKTNDEKRASASAVRGLDVRCGIDVLEEEGFQLIAKCRIGILTNQTGQAGDGRSTVDVLRSREARKAGVSIVHIFSPEHGIRGTADEKVANGIDEETGLPIISLYSESRRPRAEDLKDLDAIIIDLQDAGCRFYTYLATMGYMMEEAAKAKIRIVVLDRPNPIGADRYEGPLADSINSSFISYHNIPIRTGMTIGELARMFNTEKNINCALEVVAMKQYQRDLWYDETGLPWTNPSPNLRSVSAALLYPGLCLLEFTNVSVGRGTDSPFLQFGAPWMDGRTVAVELGKRNPPGVRFLPVRFTPSSSQYTNQECSGVRIEITNRAVVEPVLLGFEIACILRDSYKNEWERKRFGELLANAETLEYFEAGAKASAFSLLWRSETASFFSRRLLYLLYKNPPF